MHADVHAIICFWMTVLKWTEAFVASLTSFSHSLSFYCHRRIVVIRASRSSRRSPQSPSPPVGPVRSCGFLSCRAIRSRSFVYVCGFPSGWSLPFAFLEFMRSIFIHVATYSCNLAAVAWGQRGRDTLCPSKRDPHVTLRGATYVWPTALHDNIYIYIYI